MAGPTPSPDYIDVDALDDHGQQNPDATLIVLEDSDDEEDVKLVTPLNLLSRNSSTLSLAATSYSDDDMDAWMQAYEPDEPVVVKPLLKLGVGPSRVVVGQCPLQAKRPANDDSPFPATKKAKSNPTLVDDNDDNPFQETPQRVVDTQLPSVIYHNQRFQVYFDKLKLPFGVQYEFARHLLNRDLREEDCDIQSIQSLKGMNNALGAPDILKKFKPAIDHSTERIKPEFAAAYTREKEANSPWKEQDLEDKYMAKNKNAGLGFSDEDPTWFGGKANYRARVRHATASHRGSEFEVVLERAELGPSNRFARQFGSKLFLRVKVPKDMWNYEKKLINYFKKPFILNGRVYRAFYEKDKTVFLFATNEGFKGGKIIPDAHADSVTFQDFLHWHNPIEEDIDQKMTKWASRFALGLSNSAPGVILKPENIREIPDRRSSNGDDMTDGCGVANIAALRAIQRRFDFEVLPTAVQVRINGVKGLIARSSNDLLNAEPEVEVRPSMVKIKTEPTDQAHCTIDVLRISHAGIGSPLSAEVIINLGENGVPVDAFKSLLEMGLEAMIAPFKDWEKPNAMLELFAMVARHGGVMSARAARRAVSMARLKGHKEKKDVLELEDNDEEGLMSEEGSTAWWADEVSGQPSGLDETVMVLLAAGFTPKECPLLRNKLLQSIKTSVNTHVKKCRILVPMSATAFIIPDEDGVLEEDEIFFKSSRRNLVGADGLETDIVTGPVLLTRHPCKLPSDVRKWTAVDKPCLRDRPDVIIMSVKGLRRMADYLSGGDYDGDKGLLIWQPELVNPFRNADLRFSIPPSDLENNFSKTNESVSDFLKRASPEKVGEVIHREGLQDFLLGGLNHTSVVGSYSNMHDTAAYSLGYDHPETKRLAYMFCNVLDGSKTGLRVKTEVLKEDLRKYGSTCWWKERMEDKESQDNIIYAKRKRGARKFIMDLMLDHAMVIGDQQLASLEAFFQSHPVTVDRDLKRPWEDAWARVQKIAELHGPVHAQLLKDELTAIQDHVQAQNVDFKASKANRTPSSHKKKGAGFTGLPIEKRQDLLRQQSRAFAAGPVDLLHVSPAEMATLRASYAYIYDAQVSFNQPRHAWNVAMRALCAIKAEAVGNPATISGEFYEHMKMANL